jgi:hypothetical protein
MRFNSFQNRILNTLDELIASGCGGISIPSPIPENNTIRFSMFEEQAIAKLQTLVTAGCGNNIDTINLELQLTDSLNRYKEFIYTGDNLTSIEIWDSPSKLTQYFETTYTYIGDNLTEIEITRISDGFIYTKELTYDINNNLTSINITTPI